MRITTLSKGYKSFALSLLGINNHRNKTKQTPVQARTDCVCFIVICVSAGYLATMQGFESLPVNADSLAPFEEAQSLLTTPGAHLFNIHVSRIPSIFPDMTINSLLQFLYPNAGFLEIFSLYSWCTSSIFLLLATVLTQKIETDQQTLTATAIKISLVTFSLLNLSHQFNISYAHIMTPVHHGGSVLNTLLLLILTLEILKKSEAKKAKVSLFILTSLASMSNRVSLFTGILPALALFSIYLNGTNRRNLLIYTLIATAAGLLVGSLLNEQCATPEFSLTGTTLAFRKYFQLSWMTSTSLFFSLASLLYIATAKLALPQNTRAGLFAISLSSLSYIAYLPALTNHHGDAPTRYIITAYTLLVIFFVFWLENIISRFKLDTTALIAIITITLISFQFPIGNFHPYLNFKNHQSLKQELLDRGERIEPFRSDAARFIQRMGYESYLGLGEFWTTATTLISNSQIQLIAILKSGKPNFWSATPKAISQQIKGLNKNKAYLISESEEFQKNFEGKYGSPEITWYYDSAARRFTQRRIVTNSKLLIYNNKNIYNTIERRAKKFKRQCNKSLPNYSKR